MSLSWFAAARENDFEFIVKNVSTYIRSESPRESRTALMLSSRHANAQLVSLLRREVGLRDIYGRTALMYAAHFNNSSIISLLGDEKECKCLRFGALRGATALQIAAQAHNLSICRALVEEARVSEMSQQHLNALFHQPARDDIADSQRRTPFHYAALNPEEASDEFYAEFENFSLDITGKSPLHLAVESGNIACIEFITKSAQSHLELNFVSKYGKNTTALMWAVENRNEHIFELLSPYYMGDVTDIGITCLVIAVLKGFNEFIQACFASEFQKRLNAKFAEYSQGSTIFEIAEQSGNLRGLEILRTCEYHLNEPKHTNDETLRSHIKEQKSVIRMRSSSTSREFHSGPFKRSASASSTLRAPEGASTDMRVSDLRGGVNPNRIVKEPLNSLMEKELTSLREQIGFQTNSLRVYQNREKQLLEELKSFEFPSNYSLEQCVNALAESNNRLSCELMSLKTQEIASPCITVNPSDKLCSLQQLASSANNEENEVPNVVPPESGANEPLSELQLAHLSTEKELMECLEIFSIFYPEDVPSLEIIAEEAQLLGGQLRCSFSDIASLLQHLEKQLELKEDIEREAIMELAECVGGTNVISLDGANLTDIVNLAVDRMRAASLGETNEMTSSSAASLELQAELDGVRGSVRSLTGELLTADNANAALEGRNEALESELAGVKAELAACQGQLRQNLAYRGALLGVLERLEGADADGGGAATDWAGRDEELRLLSGTQRTVIADAVEALRAARGRE